jgi:hypothetical protein
VPPLALTNAFGPKASGESNGEVVTDVAEELLTDSTSAETP